MKKLFFLIVLLLAIPLAIFGQDIPNPPAGWGDILVNPTAWIGSFAAVAVLTAFLAAFFNGLFKFEKGFLKQLVAWLVAIILLVVTDLFNVGYAKDFPILLAIIHGLAAGLASNGVFNIPFMKSVLDAIQGFFPKKEINP